MDLRDVLTVIAVTVGVLALLRLRTWSVRQGLRQERLSRPPRLEVDFELSYLPRRRVLSFVHAGTVTVRDVEVWVGPGTDRPADHAWPEVEPGETIEVHFDAAARGIEVERQQIDGEWDSFLTVYVELRSRRESGVAERDTWPRAYVD